MFATDEETALKEFLDEEVPCESDDNAEGHAAEVYVKLSCVHCGNAVLWPTCMPCWNLLQISFIVNSTVLACKICKKDVVLSERSEIVGPVR